jgi:hypothetical protein
MSIADNTNSDGTFVVRQLEILSERLNFGLNSSASGAQAVAVGVNTNAGGINSVCIGNIADDDDNNGCIVLNASGLVTNSTQANTIILNASSLGLGPNASGTYISPLRENPDPTYTVAGAPTQIPNGAVGVGCYPVGYNAITKELFYYSPA